MFENIKNSILAPNLLGVENVTIMTSLVGLNSLYNIQSVTHDAHSLYYHDHGIDVMAHTQFAHYFRQ